MELQERWVIGDPLPELGGYHLVNPEKVDRAINGVMNPKSERIGGIADAEGRWDPTKLLPEYDRIGGFITNKDGDKVKTGSFYDFRAKKPRETPEVTLIYQVNGEFVEIPETEEKPMIVKAAKILEERQKENAKKKRAKK